MDEMSLKVEMGAKFSGYIHIMDYKSDAKATLWYCVDKNLRSDCFLHVNCMRN